MDKKTIRSYFESMDTDADGVLDRSEFQALLNKMGLYRSEEVINMAFADIDCDNNNQITFEEFTTWWQKSDQLYSSEEE